MSLPRLSLAAVLLLASAAHASEIALAVPHIGPSASPHFRYGTAVASSGHGYLIAWEEREMHAYPPGTILARAFDERGVPLHNVPAMLGVGVAPSIAWNGREYLLVFGELGSRYGSAVPLPVAAMMRIAEDGTPIDQAPVILTRQLNAYAYGTSVAWNGAEYAVCWNGYVNGAALVTPDLRIRRLDVSAAGAPMSVASNGSGFLIAAITQSGELHLLPVSSTGEPGATQVVGPGRSASLTSVDGEYELLWSTAAGLQAARVASIQNPTMLSAVSTAFERVVARNGAVLASWIEYPHAPSSNTTRICTERLDIASQPVCSDESDDLHDSSIAAADDTFLLAWSDRTSGIDEVRIDVTAKWTEPRTGDGRIISEAAASQQQPEIERRADGGIAAVWTEVNPITGRYEIHFGGLGARGGALPDRAIMPSPRDQYDPQISTANGHSLVTWNDVNSTQTRRIGIAVDDAGNAVSAPISFEGSTGGGAIAFDGAEWLVIWTAAGNVHFSMVDRNGQVTQTGSIDEAFSPITVAAAGGDGRFVVAWSEGDTHSIRATQINGGMPGRAMLLDTATSNFVLDVPAVAIHGNRTLVSWHAQSSDARPSELRQALLDEHGARLGANTVLAWRPYLYRLRARSAPRGFALMTASSIVLTSLDGKMTGVVDVAANTIISDFLADSADRFTIAYARPATFDEHLGLTARAFVRTVVPARNRSLRLR